MSGYYVISATAVRPQLQFFDVDSRELRDLITQPAKARRTGWTTLTATRAYRVRHDEVGIAWGEPGANMLRVFRNGRIDYSIPIDNNFCWHQTAQEFTIRPSLAPIVLIEYTVSFLRLAFDLWKRVEPIKPGPVDRVLIDFSLLRILGTTLRPYSPNQFGWLDMGLEDVRPYGRDTYKSPRLDRTVVSDPDETAFEILKNVYAAFGLGSDMMPFFDSANRRFLFPQG